MLCLNIYSQVNSESMIKSIGLMDATHFGVALNSKNSVESINTHLNIPKGYEFRNQIVAGNEHQTRDDYGFVHERYDQYYEGIKVEHSDVRTHYLNDKLVTINGEYIDAPVIDISIILSKEAAVRKAIEYIGAKKYIWEDERECGLITSNTKIFSSSCYPNPETVICRNDFAPEDMLFHVAYKVNIRALEPFSDDYVYVDAKTGKILNSISQIYYVNGTAATRYSGTKTISTQLSGSTYRLRGYDNSRSIETYNMQNSNSFKDAIDYTDSDNNWTAPEYHNVNRDDAGLDAHWGAMVTWDYFSQTFGWKSYNSSGATLKNYVNAQIAAMGIGLSSNDNAFWDGGAERIIYGTGFGTSYDAFVSLEIVAHEFAHGINKYTSKLGGSGEPGAIQEGLSDIWSIVVSNYANTQFSGLNKNIWLFANELGNPMRSFSKPDSLSRPSTYGGPNWDLTGSNVHRNSNVMSHWFYLLSVGGSGTNTLGVPYSVTGIGIGNAAQIVRDAQKDVITANSNYNDVRSYTISCAAVKYGTGSAQHISVTNAWHAVGVGNRYPPVITGPKGGLCSGSSGTFSVTNILPGYTWSCSANLSISGSGSSVSVSATGGASSTGWISVNSGGVELSRLTVPVSTSAPVFSYIDGPEFVTPGSSTYNYYASFSNGSPYVYEWVINGAPSNWYYHTAYSNSLSICFMQEATYYIGVTGYNGCGWDTGSILVEAYSKKSPKQGEELEEAKAEVEEQLFTSYPNPAGDVLNIEINKDNRYADINPTFEVRLYNWSGILMRNTTIKGSSVQFNVSKLPNGIYYLNVYDKVNDKSEVKQIIVQH